MVETAPSDIALPQRITTPPSRTRVLVIVGPTAVGKTEVAEKVATILDGEIVSADSMQVYRTMDIGTAKPAVEDRGVLYHCIDLVEPGEPFSAALFQGCARAAIEGIASRRRLPILAGGTGLYVRAAIDDWEFPAGAQTHNPSRERWETFAEQRGSEALHSVLAEKDPASAAMIHPNNVRRVVRALEMLEEGVSYADQHEGFSARDSIYDVRIFGLEMERDALYRHIGARVDSMMERDLLGEVRTLLDQGFRDALTSAQAIGYKELVPVIESDADLETAVESIKQATRRYAKRQLTWFRADPRVAWLDVTETAPATTAEAIAAALDCS